MTITQILDDEGVAGDDVTLIGISRRESSISMAGGGDAGASADRPEALSISTDARRKIIRQCLDLKRLMDKEGNSIYAESSIQKTLFSRTSTSISVLFRCLRSTPDIDTCIVVTNLLLRLVTTSECNQTNLATMAKKNLTAVLMRCLQLYHQDYLVPSAPTISPNLSQRLDDVLVNIMTLLVKLSKFDFTDAALPSIQKSNILVIIEQILKNPPPQLSQSKLDCVVELLAIFSKSRTICLEIMHMLGVKLFLTLSTSGYDAVQRASLRLLRIVIDYDFGKRMFDAADGAKYLTDALHSILHTSDGASTALSSTSSTPALLVAVLRAAVAHSDLPFLPHFQDRLFPLPLKHVPGTNTQPSVSQEKSVQDGALNLGFDTLEGERDYERLVDEYTAKIRRGGKLPGKIVFEHTARMFQPSTKGVLVYDVMDDRVAQAAMQMHDGTLLFDSRFESGNLQMAIRVRVTHFKPAQISRALTKGSRCGHHCSQVSQFEYDLVVQTDINAMQGKHNQWFYFSVQRMVPNTPYKFNILNLSKPASQFNHGMQPVVYSVSDPGWRRSGDCVFYIKQVGLLVSDAMPE
nr:Cytosolic carboxypeptidase 4 [Polyrhizophydium stewartii]